MNNNPYKLVHLTHPKSFSINSYLIYTNIDISNKLIPLATIKCNNICIITMFQKFPVNLKNF